MTSTKFLIFFFFSEINTQHLLFSFFLSLCSFLVPNTHTPINITFFPKHSNKQQQSQENRAFFLFLSTFPLKLGLKLSFFWYANFGQKLKPSSTLSSHKIHCKFISLSSFSSEPKLRGCPTLLVDCWCKQTKVWISQFLCVILFHSSLIFWFSSQDSNPSHF